jgi:hypothetical protein
MDVDLFEECLMVGLKNFELQQNTPKLVIIKGYAKEE